jgi:probable HAF family extracellular repeat protein
VGRVSAVSYRLLLISLALLAGWMVGAPADAQTPTTRFTFKAIDLPRTIFVSGQGINDDGVVVGEYQSQDGALHAFVFVPGAHGDQLAVCPRPGYEAFGINNAGQIVGRSSNPGFRGFLTTISGCLAGDFTLFDFPGSADTTAVGINNVGQILGWYVPTNVGGSVGFLCTLPLTPTCFTSFTLPASDCCGGSLVFGINDQRDLVGQYLTLRIQDFVIHGFLNDKNHTIDEPDAGLVNHSVFTQTTAINNAGDIVGNYIDSAGTGHGFLLKAGASPQRIDPDNSAYTEIWGINNRGQIVGWYQDQAFQTHGFIGTPSSCVPQLTASVNPSSIPPVLPSAFPLPPPEAVVTATLNSCSLQAGTISVTLTVQPPAIGTPSAGGHNHDSTRPTGLFLATLSPTATCNAVLNATGMGSCTLTYLPSEVSGVETIVASAPGFLTVQTQVSVEIRDLFEVDGGQSECARGIKGVPGIWCLTGVSPAHPDNHWGSLNTVASIETIARDFSVYSEFVGTSALLGINDLSLKQGGVFDLNSNWIAPHRAHRVGRSADVDRCAQTVTLQPGKLCTLGNPQHPRPSAINVPKPWFYENCQSLGGSVAREPTYHCEFPQ